MKILGIETNNLRDQDAWIISVFIALCIALGTIAAYALPKFAAPMEGHIFLAKQKHSDSASPLVVPEAAIVTDSEPTRKIVRSSEISLAQFAKLHTQHNVFQFADPLFKLGTGFFVSFIAVVLGWPHFMRNALPHLL